MNKEPTLGCDVIKALIRLWPRASTAKQVLFLEELEVILESLNVDMLDPVLLPAFRQV